MRETVRVILCVCLYTLLIIGQGASHSTTGLIGFADWQAPNKVLALMTHGLRGAQKLVQAVLSTDVLTPLCSNVIVVGFAMTRKHSDIVCGLSFNSVNSVTLQ